MSGGHFDYNQYKIGWIVDEIEQIIRNNDVKNDDGTFLAHHYSANTIVQFENAVRALKMAQVYAQRIDWLVSGDDGEDTFHQRLRDDLNGIK